MADIGLTKGIGKKWIKSNRDRHEMDQYKVDFDIIMDDLGNILDEKAGKSKEL